MNAWEYQNTGFMLTDDALEQLCGPDVPVIGAALLKDLTSVAASCPVIASTTKSVSVGLIACTRHQPAPGT